MSEFILYKAHNRLTSEVRERLSTNIKHFDWVETQYRQAEDWELIYTKNKSDELEIFDDNEDTFILHGYICESDNFGQGYSFNDNQQKKSECIIERYRQEGIDGLIGLNGVYHLFVWNRKTKILEIASDRLGLLQVFFFPLGEESFVLTTNLINLNSICPEKIKINKRGLFDLLFIGNGIGDRTVLESAYRILSNSSFQVKDGTIRILKKRKLIFTQENWNAITPKILNKLEECYKKAVKRHLDPASKYISLQSAGRDSRLLSYMLKQSGVIPTTVTVGEKHHLEAHLSQLVSKQLGFSWKRVPIKDNFEGDFVDRVFAIDSFSRKYMAPWFYLIFDKETVAAHDHCLASFVIHDIMGGPISKGKLEDNPDDKSAFESYISVLRQGFLTMEQLKLLLGDEAVEFANDYIKEAFELFLFQGEETYQRLIAFDLQIQNRMKIGGNIRCINAALPIRMPGIDIDLMDFIFSLPPALLHNRQIIDMYLTNKAKEIGEIPLDQNDDARTTTLVPTMRSLVPFCIWRYIYLNFVIPILRVIDPVKGTMRAYVQIYSMKNKGFREIQEKVLAEAEYCNGYMDINCFKEFLEMDTSGKSSDILSGNSKRSLIAVSYVLKTFTHGREEESKYK